MVFRRVPCWIFSKQSNWFKIQLVFFASLYLFLSSVSFLTQMDYLQRCLIATSNMFLIYWLIFLFSFPVFQKLPIEPWRYEKSHLRLIRMLPFLQKSFCGTFDPSSLCKAYILKSQLLRDSLLHLAHFVKYMSLHCRNLWAVIVYIYRKLPNSNWNVRVLSTQSMIVRHNNDVSWIGRSLTLVDILWQPKEAEN